MIRLATKQQHSFTSPPYPANRTMGRDHDDRHHDQSRKKFLGPAGPRMISPDAPRPSPTAFGPNGPESGPPGVAPALVALTWATGRFQFCFLNWMGRPIAARSSCRRNLRPNIRLDDLEGSAVSSPVSSFVRQRGTAGVPYEQVRTTHNNTKLEILTPAIVVLFTPLDQARDRRSTACFHQQQTWGLPRTALRRISRSGPRPDSLSTPSVLAR